MSVQPAGTIAPDTASGSVQAKLSALMARAQDLYEDLSFTSVQEWKKRDPSRRAIGFLPVYVPREVIHACGALPVGIMGGGDQLEIVRGDSYFQSYICHLPRSVIEMAVSGRLDALDGFLFPSICDVVRNLSGMFKVLLKDKYVHYLDLPQNFDAAIGGRFYRHEIESVAKAISDMTGIPFTEERMRDSLRLYNDNRRAIERLCRRRKDRPWEVPTIEYYLLLRAGYVLPVEEHTEMLDDYLDLVAKVGRRKLDNIRIIVRGAFCEQPPLGLLNTLDRSGCYVVDDDFVHGIRLVPDPICEDGDPLEALTHAFMHHSLPAASKYDQERRKGDELVKCIRECQAEGVILMAPSFCDPALLDQPMLQSALEQAEIPFTTFKYSEDTGQFQVIREQAGTFADAIKLWGSV